MQLAEVEGASAWTQDRAREWWATHQLALALGDHASATGRG